MPNRMEIQNPIVVGALPFDRRKEVQLIVGENIAELLSVYS